MSRALHEMLVIITSEMHKSYICKSVNFLKDIFKSYLFTAAEMHLELSVSFYQ